MNECFTSIQPPGMMKVGSTHHQEHQTRHQGLLNNCFAIQDVVCHPHIVRLPHEQLHGAAGRPNKAG